MIEANAKDKGKSTEGFKPKRGRPTPDQVAAIDNVLLTVARSLFLENGYATTSMEAVALTAGVSKGTLYSRYPTKQDLFEAIAAERLDAWVDNVANPIDTPNLPVDEYLFRYGLLIIAALRSPEVAAFDRLITSEAARFPELARAFQERGYGNVIKELASAIGLATSDAGRPLQDPESVATAFMYGILGWYRSTTMFREVSEDECAEYVRRLLAIFMGGRAVW